MFTTNTLALKASDNTGRGNEFKWTKDALCLSSKGYKLKRNFFANLERN